MSQQDNKTSANVINQQTIKQVVDWLFVPAIFAGIKVRAGATWKPRMLATTALLWASGEQSNLKDRFVLARKIVKKIFRWQTAPGETYQGFIKVLRRWHASLMRVITTQLHLRMRETLPDHWKVAGHVVFAADGSRIELARTKSLEAAYSPRRKKQAKKKRTKGNGKVRNCDTTKATHRKAARKRQAAKKQSQEAVEKKANSPQMWLTLLWHVGSGLPWSWRTGPSDSSERGHLQEMLQELPENSLITADAGFIGYEFWKSVLDSGHDFVIRVGGNVRLLQELGCARQHRHTVYLWPDAVAKKKLPPLVLRLVVVNNGKHPVFLVTNLTKSQLSDRQAATIYRARWGIELFFRTFKQTFGCRKLRSRAAANAPIELDWSLLALWCVCLLGQRELVASGQDPRRLSPAAAIKALQQTLHEWRVRPERPSENLWNQLRRALLDDYERTTSKTSRNYPRKKKRERVGAPKIEKASERQIAFAQQLTQQQTEFQFTA